jgi:hypothetical protein
MDLCHFANRPALNQFDRSAIDAALQGKAESYEL